MSSPHRASVSTSAFNGVKVFGATMYQQRETLGEQVTQWLDDARRNRPGFQLVDMQVRQSSDRAFHLISIIIFFNEDTTVGKEKKPRG